MHSTVSARGTEEKRRKRDDIEKLLEKKTTLTKGLVVDVFIANDTILANRRICSM
jgi:hypothetical protein